jgi:hypothetical protein
MKIKNLGVALVAGLALMGAVGSASADTLAITPANQTGPAGSQWTLADGNDPYFITFTADVGEDTGSFEAQFTFPPELTITPVAINAATAECAVIGAGRIRIQVSAAAPLATGNYCRLDVVVGAAAPNAVYTMDWDDPTALFLVVAPPFDTPSMAPHTLVNATVTVAAAPPATPPTLTFAPASGTIASGASFTITPSGGQAGGSATYTCTPPAGVTLTNGAGAISTGGAAVTVTPTCPAGNPDGSLSCTHTGGAGSTASPVTYTVDCPAAAAPVVAGNPPPGALTCNGNAGSTQTTSVTFTNTGTGNATGFSCAVGGAGFSLQTPPAATINSGGGSTTATVACTVPADGAAPINGTLNCSGTGVGPFAYTVSSVAVSAAVPTQAAIVPASSLWSKIGLVGLLAALGMLVVGFRRQH